MEIQNKGYIRMFDGLGDGDGRRMYGLEMLGVGVWIFS